MKTPSPKLIHILIGKSILETILVGTLAVVAFMTFLPPSFRGWGEVSGSEISGWAVDSAAPWDRVEVQLFIDGVIVTSAPATLARPDVQAAGWARDAWHGYAFRPPQLSPGDHEARIYALHDSGGGKRKTLQMLGNPIRFSVAANGQLLPTAPRRDQ